MTLAIAAVAVFALALLAASLLHGVQQPQAHPLLAGAAGSSDPAAMAVALQQRIRFFREDITNTPTQEAQLSNLSDRGAQFIGILDYDTLDVSFANGSCASNCNWSLADWNHSVSKAIASYPEVHIWEIWNEPQISTFQDGYQNGSAYNYYITAKSAYLLIKAHNQSDTVLCLGGDNIFTGSPQSDEYDFLWARAVWSYGLAEYCDGISLHAYSGFIYLMNQTPSGYSQTTGALFSKYLDAYENLTGKPVWVTEVGLPSNHNISGIPPAYFNSSLQKQATFLNQTFSLFASKPYVRAAVWFNLVGSVHPPYNFDFGLLNATTLEPKPALSALRPYLVK